MGVLRVIAHPRLAHSKCPWVLTCTRDSTVFGYCMKPTLASSPCFPAYSVAVEKAGKPGDEAKRMLQFTCCIWTLGECGSRRRCSTTVCRTCSMYCRVFWFSILVLVSGWRVKSGAKYSKYSVEGGREGGRGGGQWSNCVMWYPA